MQHSKLRFKTSMIWEPEISEFVKSRMKGYTLNAPCGSSTLGDVRVDTEPTNPATYFGDFLSFMPGEQSIFDTVISDPPWKVQYYHRPRWFFKAVELCKTGGTITYNAPWVPTSKYAELTELWVRQSTTFSNVSCLSVFKKLREVEPQDRLEAVEPSTQRSDIASEREGA